MSYPNLTLSNLIGPCICHDLISPIGAIRNGLELMEFSGSDHTGPEIALIEQSCAAAAARIEFFRIAYGAAVSGQDIGHRETIHIGNNIFKNTRIKVQ